MRMTLDLNSAESYRRFLAIKSLPQYSFVGREAIVPDEYADRLGMAPPVVEDGEYGPIPGLFDYQEAIARLAIRKRKFAVFADMGLGKTLMLLEYARHVAAVLPPQRAVLIVSPLMVVRQTIQECERFYGDSLVIELVRSKDLGSWLGSGVGRIGITNYEALTARVEPGRLGALICDESSLLKSLYGKWGQEILRLGRRLDWKLALTGTPAPNDRIEYANHAVFLDAFPNVNSFLARFFVNRGQTDNRWELKPHALVPFYRALSHWCIFLTNPSTYGWRDNTDSVPPIHVHIHDVPLLPLNPGGITRRTKLARIAKGHHNGKAIETNKVRYIRDLVASWPEESTLIWCLYDDEQAALERALPDAASIKGATRYETRETLIADFKAGGRRVLISKAKVLGFGMNLQVATRQVFSSLQDSYEMFAQCVKRSNRVGSTQTLNVHIPVSDLERPMIETVLRKAHRVQEDTESQERIFKDASLY